MRGMYTGRGGHQEWSGQAGGVQNSRDFFLDLENFFWIWDVKPAAQIRKAGHVQKIVFCSDTRIQAPGHVKRKRVSHKRAQLPEQF